MSENEAHSCEALRWLRYAEEDLLAATKLMESASAFVRPVCCHSHQAAEKALKAVLVFEQLEVPFIHDLNRLRGLIPDGWDVVDSRPVLAHLTEWAASARYPGDWIEPTESEAAWAVSQATAVYESVAAEFGRRGLESQ